MIENKLDGSGERLRVFRKKLGKSQIELASILKTSHGHISGMEKDKKNITESTIELLKVKLNLNEDYLRYGKGEPLQEVLPEDEYIAAAAEISKNKDEFAMQAIIDYWSLDNDSKQLLKDYIFGIVDEVRKRE